MFTRVKAAESDVTKFIYHTGDVDFKFLCVVSSDRERSSIYLMCLCLVRVVESAVTSKLNPGFVQIFSPYRAVNTLSLSYKNQSVNVV